MNIAIIPARQNSKRIKNKNKRLFLNKPIIEYAIESAEKSELFDSIVISTDDPEIQAHYKCQAWIIGRSREAASDTATLTEVIQEALMQLEDGGICPDNICVILPCAVFIDSDDLLLAYDDLEYNDCVISVCEYSHPTARELGYIDNIFQMIRPEFENKRTQDIERSFYDAGQFYWLNVKAFKEQQKIFMDRLSPYIIEAIDIDTEEDWTKAEAICGHTRILEG